MSLFPLEGDITLVERTQLRRKAKLQDHMALPTSSRTLGFPWLLGLSLSLELSKLAVGLGARHWLTPCPEPLFLCTWLQLLVQASAL